MHDIIKRYKKNKDATTAVEFALVAIPFLLVIFGTMEAGRLIWSMNGVQYAVEETGRYAALNSDLTNVDFQNYAQELLVNMYIETSSLQITSSTDTSNGIEFVQVDGVYSHTSMLNGILPEDFGNLNFDVSVRKPVIN